MAWLAMVAVGQEDRCHGRAVSSIHSPCLEVGFATVRFCLPPCHCKVYELKSERMQFVMFCL